MNTKEENTQISLRACDTGVAEYPAALARMSERVESLKECFRITGLINSSLELDQVLENIMVTSRSILKADACSLMLVDEKSGELVFAVAQGPASDKLKQEVRIRKGQGIAGNVYETGEPLLIENAYEDSRFNREVDRLTGYRTQTILCVPLKIKERIIGVSQAINKMDGSNFNEEDKETLSLLCANAAIAIENARLHREILRRRQIEQDLAFARSIQLSFLPLEMPKLKGFRFGAHYQPARQIGGDFYDFIPLDGNRVGILIGDVSGKGVSAALFMARFTSDFRLRAIREKDPERLVGRINESVCAQSCQGMFVTLLYIVLEEGGGEAVYVNAGHLPPIIWNSSQGDYAVLRGIGDPPIGIVPDRHYGAAKLSLTPGACILLSTDGLLEAKNDQGMQFGWQRIENCLTAGDSEVESVKSRISVWLSKFAGECPQADDITLVLIGFEEN
ncbi:MAG TPA: SpoIIE family protein phosphatase [Syntrophobacteraceae bacterium]|nr:SpoIIE family protein phosphatase [Syntrophobacteraceae bacterium]